MKKGLLPLSRDEKYVAIRLYLSMYVCLIYLFIVRHLFNYRIYLNSSYLHIYPFCIFIYSSISSISSIFILLFYTSIHVCLFIYALLDIYSSICLFLHLLIFSPCTPLSGRYSCLHLLRKFVEKLYTPV